MIRLNPCLGVESRRLVYDRKNSMHADVRHKGVYQTRLLYCKHTQGCVVFQMTVSQFDKLPVCNFTSSCVFPQGL